jgi:hypothetical protein
MELKKYLYVELKKYLYILNVINMYTISSNFNLVTNMSLNLLKLDFNLLNVYIRDYLNSFSNEFLFYNVLFLICCFIQLIGLYYSDSKYYWSVNLKNFLLLTGIFFTNLITYIFNQINQNNYSTNIWINSFVNITLVYLFMNNQNILFDTKNYTNSVFIDDDYEFEQSNSKNTILFEDNQDNVQDNIQDNEDNQDNQDNQDDQDDQDDEDYELEDQDDQDNQDNQDDSFEFKKEYLNKYFVFDEVDQYVDYNISVYKKILLGNSRLTNKEMDEITNILGNKISNRENRMLIRAINQIIKKKLI